MLVEDVDRVLELHSRCETLDDGESEFSDYFLSNLLGRLEVGSPLIDDAELSTALVALVVGDAAPLLSQVAFDSHGKLKVSHEAILTHVPVTLLLDNALLHTLGDEVELLAGERLGHSLLLSLLGVGNVDVSSNSEISVDSELVPAVKEANVLSSENLLLEASFSLGLLDLHVVNLVLGLLDQFVGWDLYLHGVSLDDVDLGCIFSAGVDDVCWEDLADNSRLLVRFDLRVVEAVVLAIEGRSENFAKLHREGQIVDLSLAVNAKVGIVL